MAIIEIRPFRNGWQVYEAPGVQTVLKRWRIMQKAIGPPLNKAGLTFGGRLSCQNDSKFLITESS
jgi:hypothetical protein